MRRLAELAGVREGHRAVRRHDHAARTVERGALVDAGNGATPMFTLVATDPVRVFVDVPQTVAPSVQVGNAGDRHGARVRRAHVHRQGDALGGRARSRRCTRCRPRSSVPNPDGALLPGMYVQAALTLPVPHRVLEIPATALYNDAARPARRDGRRAEQIHFVPITIERDTGATLWIATGLTGDERIVKIAVPSLVEGDAVEVDPPAAHGTAAK